MSYSIRFSSEAEKDFARLDQTMRRRILERMELLSADPFDARVGKPLKGLEALRSSRVGSWRILYQINQSANEIAIVTIRPRGRAYRNL